jgi:hypothetical protein
MKNRKQLPAFGYLNNITIDIDILSNYLDSQGLLDFANYDHIQLDKATKFKGFVIANQYLLNNMFKGKDEPMNNSNNFRQIQLTEFDQSLSKGEVEFQESTFIERIRRQNPNHPKYIPEAAELNYGRRNELVTGEIEKIFDIFTSKITRGRLAFLAPGHTIRAHIDYDTTLVCRYHIPVLTNPEVKFYVQHGKNISKYYMPNDGRIYFFNQGLKHWVKNEGSAPRLHLIIDVHGQSELENMTPIECETIDADSEEGLAVIEIGK